MQVVIDGSILRGRDAYHSHLAEVLQLPGYYGRNLDALYDLLSVMDTPTQITIRHLPSMREDLGTYAEQLIETLEDAARTNPRVTLHYDHDAPAPASHEVDAEVQGLQADPSDINDFISRHENYIKSRVHAWVCRVSTTTAQRLDADDLWSIALSAFAEAVEQYDISRGAFYAFAALVIDRRLTDHYRYALRHAREISIDPILLQANPGQTDNAQAKGIISSVNDSLTAVNDDTLTLEIDAVVQVLADYGFSFFDLAGVSPRAEKTRQACAKAVEIILESPLLLSEMRASRQLPVKTLEKRTGVPRKTLERHRKYIVAAAEILDGDFPGLAEYLRHIKGRQRQ